jgi:hypothetical protein
METREKETLNEDVENITVVNWQWHKMNNVFKIEVVKMLVF